MKKIGFLLVFIFGLGCSTLHSVQVGEIHSDPNLVSVPFEIKVSEIGIDLGEAKSASAILMNERDSKRTNEALQFIQYFQMGPHTGAGVYSIKYVDHLENKIRQKCPSGFITGLMSIRETAEYPIVKGEIIKIKGYCLKKKGENL